MRQTHPFVVGYNAAIEATRQHAPNSPAPDLIPPAEKMFPVTGFSGMTENQIIRLGWDTAARLMKMHMEARRERFQVRRTHVN